MKHRLDMNKKIESQPALDKWSGVHALMGYSMGLLRFPRPIAYGLIILTEVIEFMLAPSTEFFQESRKNIFADLVIGTVAFELGTITGLPRP